MQSGKDTFYTYAHTQLKNTARTARVAFADAIKQEVADATGFTTVFVNDNKPRFRTILQWWGTEFRRDLCHKNYWLDRLKEKVNQLHEGTVVFITDVRFTNEAELIRSMGGIIVRMERVYTWRQKVKRFFTLSGIRGHASEVEQDKIVAEYTIRAGSVNELCSEADNLLLNLTPWLLAEPAKRAYIAGPMRKIKNFNFPAFYAAEAYLKLRGFEVGNPAAFDEEIYGKGFAVSETGDLADIPQFDFRKALLADLTYIISKATHIVLLPGWNQSSGAQVELAVARVIGLKVLYFEDL